MGLITSIGDFFGIDIGTSAIRVVQLRGGSRKNKALVVYGSTPVDVRTTGSDSKVDQQKLAETVAGLIQSVGISARNVAVGIPSKRSFITVVDLPRLPEKAINQSIRYQADGIIPTPLDESTVAWQLLGDAPKDPDKVEVLVSSVSNEFVEAHLEAIESIGLNVIAFEPDTLALARALVPPGSTDSTVLIDIGSQSSDIVAVLGESPRLVRSIPTGGHAFVKAAMQNLNIDEKQAEQFVFKFGLTEGKLEGQVRRAIKPTVDALVGEIEKSIKFFNSRYSENPVSKIIVTGGASVLPEFPLHLANTFGVAVEIGNAWLNVSYPSSMSNDLIAVSNHFCVAAGLAEREE